MDIGRPADLVAIRSQLTDRVITVVTVRNTWWAASGVVATSEAVAMGEVVATSKVAATSEMIDGKQGGG